MLRGRGILGPVDSRHGVRKLEEESGARPHFLLWAGIRSRDIRRVGTFYGGPRFRAFVHRPRRVAFDRNFASRAARTSGRGPVSHVDVTAAEFARISGE